PFRKRKNCCTDDWRDGTLRPCVEFADGFDGIAEEFDANRTRRFRRKKIHNAAALCELPGHFDHFRARVPYCAEVCNEAVKTDFIIGLERTSEEFVAVRRPMAPERGGNWRNEKICLPGGKTIERSSPSLEDIRVRAAHIPGQSVEGRKNGDAARGKNRSEKTECFGESFSLLVGRDEKKCRTAEFGREIGGEQSFGGRLQAGDANR